MALGMKRNGYENVEKEKFNGMDDSYMDVLEMGDDELTDERINEMAKEKYENDIIDSVVQDYQSRKDEKLPYVLTWRLLLNFIDGQQHMRVNTMSKSIDEIEPFAWWEEREVFNQLAPILETRLAKLNRADTNIKVRPATAESQDISSAKVETKLLEGLFYKLEMEKIQKEANLWSERLGSVIWKSGWDDNSGRVIGYESIEAEDEEEYLLPEFERELRQFKGQYIKKIHEGDLDLTYCTPFEIFPDSVTKKDATECRSIIHSKVYDVDEIFGMFDESIKGGTQDVISMEQTKTGSGSIGQKGNGFALNTKELENSAEVIEKWELPSKIYPSGRLIIVIKSDEDKKLVYYGKLPDWCEQEGTYELPFTVQKSVDNGEFFGKSIFERLLPIQRRYNSLRNRKKEYLNRASIGQLTYEEGSVDERFIEEEGLAPGSMIPYKRGATAPSYMDNPSLPNAFDTEESSLHMDFNRISGVSEISRDSTAPTGANSGVALSILQEQDQTRISLSASHIQTARQQIGKILLRIIKENVDYSRKVKYVGKDNEVSLIEWDSNDITSFDVYIDSKTALSETPAQRRQFVFDLMNAGLFEPDMPTEMVSKIFQMLEIGDWENYVSDINKHEERAKKENLDMVQEKPVEIWEVDDHATHLKEHTNFMVSADFRGMIDENPELFDIVNEHRKQHLEIVRNKEMAMQEAQQQQGEQQQQQG